MKNNLNEDIQNDEYYFDRLTMLKWNLTMIKIVIVLHILSVLFSIKMGDFKFVTITPFTSLMMAFFITKISIKKVQLEEMERDNNGQI